MNVEKDYEEFIALLNAGNVRYAIVGSFAVAVHARPRYTKDMDILVEPTRENAERLLRALKAFGFDSPDLTADDFLDPDCVVQLGSEPVRIGVLTSVNGCTFAEIWENRTTARYGSTEAVFIGKQQLIKTKLAAHRPQDVADLHLLGEPE